MSIPSVTGTTTITAIPAVPAVGTDSAPPAAAVRRASPSPEIEIDQATQQPVALRFPWLSRLSRQLESASGQRPAFEPAPVLGDHVDRSA